MHHVINLSSVTSENKAHVERMGVFVTNCAGDAVPCDLTPWLNCDEIKYSPQYTTRIHLIKCIRGHVKLILSSGRTEYVKM